ncbi:hypothetical protein BKA81DRAFT_87381 [Phyllosticta paracitricarpa]
MGYGAWKVRPKGLAASGSGYWRTGYGRTDGRTDGWDGIRCLSTLRSIEETATIHIVFSGSFLSLFKISYSFIAWSTPLCLLCFHQLLAFLRPCREELHTIVCCICLIQQLAVQTSDLPFWFRHLSFASLASSSLAAFCLFLHGYQQRHRHYSSGLRECSCNL